MLCLLPAAASADTVFSDNFSSSTLNGANFTPTAGSTSYQITASKNTGTDSTMGSGALRLSLDTATTSGFLEAQALFASAPITLASVGDAISLQFTFTAANILKDGTSGNGSWLCFGLYNSGGTAPLANGPLKNSGLTTTASNPNSSGGVSLWQGYNTRIGSNTVNATMYTRPTQTLADTSSQNQDLIGSNWGGGAYDTPTGQTLGTTPSTVLLTDGQQATVTFTLTLSQATELTLNARVYSGVGTGGTQLFTQTATATGANFLTSSFDGLAIGYRQSGPSADPALTINSLQVDTSLVPEPATATLAGLGLLGLLMGHRRSRR
jgi:hypothetical protein